MQAHRRRGWKAWYDEADDQFGFDVSHDGDDEPDAFPAEVAGREETLPYRRVLLDLGRSDIAASVVMSTGMWS